MISNADSIIKLVATKKRKFTTYVVPELADVIRQLAIEERRTESQMVSNLLEDALIEKGLVTRDQINTWQERLTNA